MTNKGINLSPEVTAFLDLLNHPFRNEIEHLRNGILSAYPSLTENIKWNGPNYCFEKEDRITMRIQPPVKQVQLIFHRGAKKRAPPKDKMIADESKILVWKGHDRAISTFKSLQEIEKAKAALTTLVIDWINATQ